MKTKQRNGFSSTDLLLVIATIIGMALVILPALTRPRNGHSSRISCTNKLKQVGLAFRLWAGDHQDKMPMQVSVTNGGAMEAVMEGDVAAVFLVMSNELNTPKILFCPTEQKRMQATMFEWATPTKRNPGSVSILGNTNLTYFVGVDANDTQPSMFLSGDDNILAGGGFKGDRFVSGSPINPGIVSLTTNNFIEWSDARHLKQGNVGLADGSVQGFSTAALRTALANTGVETNRLAMP